MVKQCYYDLLNVNKNANDDEIKKNYKKLAIKYHPDKNDGTDEAKEKFQTLVEAYKILINPSERAWYDSHKDQILNDNFEYFN